MTDRELLRLAAKAAGALRGDWGMECYWLDGTEWNPLTDDGDALRLAVKLGILVLTARGFAVANSSDSGGTVERLPSDPDPNAATRRAIVRAAAAIALDQVPLDPLP